jgi:carbon-monoxide dehydrogenase large subunit
MSQIGKPIRREEDFRLLQGRGRYLDDVSMMRQAHAAVLRSPVAHGDIVSVDVTAALASPGGWRC